MPSIDTLIARIALSLWSSERRVEPLPRVTVVQPWERAEIAAPAEISPMFCTLACASNTYEGI